MSKIEVLADDPESSSRPPSLLFKEIVEELCVKQGIRCECGAIEAWRASLSEDFEEGQSLTILLVCEACGRKEKMIATQREFERIGKGLIDL